MGFDSRDLLRRNERAFVSGEAVALQDRRTLPVCNRTGTVRMLEEVREKEPSPLMRPGAPTNMGIRITVGGRD